MKTRRATIQAIATTIILVLLMLGATVHVVGAASTSTTTTNATTSISTYEGQAGPNDTSSTDNQVGDNQTEGDNVNVVEIDQGEQSQIQGAEENETIAGEVQVNDTGVSASVADSRFSLVPSEGANGRLDVQISGQNVTGPRSFLITLSSSMNPTTHTLVVTLDGLRVSQASSVGQVLHPATNAATYIGVKSSSGYQLLVSVPHFSTHMLSIVTLAPGPSQGFFPINAIVLAGVAIALSALFSIAFIKRKRIYTPIA